MREEIARVVPFYDGIQHLRKTGDAFQYGGPHLCSGGVCPLPGGRARLRTVDLPRTDAGGLPFHVSTRRGKQFNTLIYAEIDPLNGAPRDAVLMNPDDAANLHLANSDNIALKNSLGTYHGRVFLAPIAPGNLQIHWPEGNVIIPHGIYDTAGGVPDYNTRVTIEKI